MPAATAGLRERRKAETRAHISAVATTAFLERGYDQVTIADVAGLAGVSKMTVTNYFPLKEDLVFDRSADIIGGPAEAVRARPPGEEPGRALHRAYLAALDRGDPTLGHKGERFVRMVEGSPTLRARSREIVEQRRTALAAALAEEPGLGRDRIGVAMAAHALAGVLEVLTDEAGRRLLAGEDEVTIVAALREGAGRLFPLAGATVAALP